MHLTAAAPLTTPSPPPPPPALPAPHGLNKYWLCHFGQKCVKPFACVWRTTTKADSVARAVEIFPFILCCLRNTLVKLHNKRARKLPKRKLQFMPKTFGKSMKKEKYFTGSGSSSSRSGSNSGSSGSNQHAAYHFLVLANQPAKSVGQCNCLYSLSECFALALSLSLYLPLSASLPLLWLFRFAAKVN